tara:strand:- start:1751 stop:2260 length:510 start_codon:yes stop_codon:yes gene_type:complete
MSELYVTRFTHETWSDNQKYCNIKCSDKGKIIYNSPKMVTKSVPYNTNMIVLEMNNTTNKIMGISIVKNRIKGTHIHKMYSDNNYNRYSYFGSNRISVENMNKCELEIMLFLENICFQGKAHIKRGQGICKINDNLFMKCKNIIDVPVFVKNMFLTREKKENKIELIVR